MKTFEKKQIISILLVFIIVLNLMPISVFANYTRTVVSEIVMTSNIDTIPVINGVITNPSFSITTGSPAHISSSSKYWQKKDGDSWTTVEEGNFTTGVWRYRAQVRIDGDDNDTHRLAEGNVLVTVNNKKWETLKTTMGDYVSYTWITSPEYTINNTSNSLMFADSSTYDIDQNIIGKSIDAFSVAGSVEGGVAPYKFSKTSGPDWIIVGQTGLIAGIPTTYGYNDDLIVRVTDSENEFREITIKVGFSIPDPTTRPEISEVEVSCPVFETIPVLGQSITLPPDSTITTTKGKPAYISPAFWQKKNGENWVETNENTFSEGTWRLQAQVRIDQKAFHDNENKIISFDTHRLANNITLKVNNNNWIVNNPTTVYNTIDNRVSFVTVYSNEYTLGSQITTHTVTFELNSGTMPGTNSVEVNKGDTVAQPLQNPTKEDFEFGGWYADDTFTNEFDFNTPITEDTTIYAKWNEKKPETFSATFDLNYDGAPPFMTINNLTSGSKLNAPNPDPSRNGYTFEGWFEDQTCTTPFDFANTQVEQNTIIYAKWTEISNNGGGQQQGGAENISFDLAWNDTYVMVWVNNKEVLGDSDVFQNSYTFNNIDIDNAGETDENKTNVIRLQNRFGDKEVSEYTINNLSYTKNSNNVEINEQGWFITVPGATKYVISATGDSSIPTPKTIIWVNPDYVPENEADAQWVSNFTVSHGIAKVVEVYDENDNLLDPNSYTNQDSDEYGLDNGFGWVNIMPGSRVVFEFVPEYGYQLTGITINETPLKAIDSNINRFEIKLPNLDGGNLHFAATFTKTDDIVKADSQKVKSGEISLGNNLEAGSAQLTINDVELSPDKIKGFENAAGDYTISNYLDIDLYNVFYKGKNDSEDVWSNKIDELEKEATITLKLADGLTADDIVIVHNIHNGEKYEIIQIESYDSTTNTITFKTKSFSNYAIATKTTSTKEENKTTNNETTKDETTSNKTTNDDTASTNEKTTAASSSPKTGDNIIMWIALMLVSILGVFVTHRYLRKRD